MHIISIHYDLRRRDNNDENIKTLIGVIQSAQEQIQVVYTEWLKYLIRKYVGIKESINYVQFINKSDRIQLKNDIFTNMQYVYIDGNKVGVWDYDYKFEYVDNKLIVKLKYDPPHVGKVSKPY